MLPLSNPSALCLDNTLQTGLSWRLAKLCLSSLYCNKIHNTLFLISVFDFNTVNGGSVTFLSTQHSPTHITYLLNKCPPIVPILEISPPNFQLLDLNSWILKVFSVTIFSKKSTLSLYLTWSTTVLTYITSTLHTCPFLMYSQFSQMAF